MPNNLFLTDLYPSGTTAEGRAGRAGGDRSPDRTGRREGALPVGSGSEAAVLHPVRPTLWCHHYRLQRKQTNMVL